MRESSTIRPPRLPERLEPLLAEFRAGKRPALARAISLVENGRDGFEALLASLHRELGKAQRIGITGPPGAGKSTLTSALVAAFRERGETVGVVAVDPTSPFTGGALLGDRIRMAEVSTDPGVFIRSMATRGSLGGLAVTTKEIADVMDAFGFDRLLIETVGVGQSELEIAAAADSTVVVLTPESGDSIQAMKAGLMEISDLFVINKADRPGAERLAREIELMLHLRAGRAFHKVPAHHGVDLNRAGAGKGSRAGAPGQGAGDAGDPGSPAGTRSGGEPAHATEPGVGTPESGHAPWSIPVLQTVAETAKGIPELVETLDTHHRWLEESGELSRRRRRRMANRVRDVVRRRLLELAWRDGGGEAILEEALPALEAGESTPYEVAARIVRAAAG